MRFKIMTIVLYEALWFAVVIAAGHDRGWLAMGLAIAFVGWQLAATIERGMAVWLVVIAVLLGSIVDGGATWLGVVRYAAASPAAFPGGPPLWILGLWASFAVTLPGPLRWLAGRPVWAALLGAVGGPLSYAGAQRGWHTVDFPAPGWHGFLWLAVAWAVAMAVLAIASRGLASGGPRSGRTASIERRGQGFVP